jgi:hypothetical protein
MIWLFLFLIFVFDFGFKYLGNPEKYTSAVSKLSDCLDSQIDVSCYVILDNFETEHDAVVRLILDINYIVTSSIGCLNLTLNVGVVNVEGICTFDHLKVFLLLIFIILF